MRSLGERALCEKMWGDQNPIRASCLMDTRGVPFSKDEGRCGVLTPLGWVAEARKG